MKISFLRFLLLSGLTLLTGGLAMAFLAPNGTTWRTVPVPEIWRRPPRGNLVSPDGYAWYRCWVKVPISWKGRKLSLYVEPMDDARAAYVNGTKVGVAGNFPPRYRSGLNAPRRHEVPLSLVRYGEWNLIALQVYFKDGRTNFSVAAPVLLQGSQAIRMEGSWQAVAGNKESHATATKMAPGFAFSKVDTVKDVERYVRLRKGDHDPYPPKDALKTFKVPGDLRLDLVLSEPVVGQPLFVSFDESGRLWVVQYLQYPDPAGLKVVSRDKHLRTVYDKVPPAPPHHFKGRDKITIHEDTNGDGIFDRHKTFVDGLSIVTSFARGRGGVWVLNPPYLLFYPDRDNDDKPDGDPEVHLSGFGIEDSHSVANSLRWGPDGWLYAAQGSTVTGHIKRPGDKEEIHSMGQLIWRYHPEKRKYEIFAEGGGNTFGVEIDSKGRIFSGHNGGDTRGFHYVQGSYSRKGFNKHGSLSNPYAFGYFPAMKHHSVPRFTHNFIIYEGAALPKQYRGRLFGIEPLQGQLVQSTFKPNGSTFQTKDISRPVTTNDQWFRPVDIKVGPDGGIYFADLYEQRIDHSSHYAGRVTRDSGRIYRLVGKDAKPLRRFNYAKKSSRELLEVLSHTNKWHRQTALRLLGDRKEKALVPELKKRLLKAKGQIALELLWALNLSGGLDESIGRQLLRHESPYVRAWTVRLLCDDHTVSSAMASELAAMAQREKHVETRSQLACSARRLPASQCLPIVRQLLNVDEDTKDPHMPLLLWWAVEAQAEKGRDAILDLLADKAVWRTRMASEHILEKLMRRYAQSGSQKDLIACGRLLKMAPGKAEAQRLMKGFELAFKGRNLPVLPQEMIEAMARVGGASLALQLRRGDPKAVEKALSVIGNLKAKKNERLQLIRIFGQIRKKQSIPVLLALIGKTKDASVRQAALLALQSYDDPLIGREILKLYRGFSPEAQEVAWNLLSSRVVWARQLLDAMAKKEVDVTVVPLRVAQRILLHDDEKLAAGVKQHWGEIQGVTTEQMRREVARLSAILSQASGNPYEGRKLYTVNCGRCHTLFEQGGAIGPDLTSYQRTDLNRILLNVVNPSAEIREGFENYLIETEDGRVLTGFLADEDNRVVVLRDERGQNHVIAKEDIVEKRALRQSLMPEGLLKDYSEQQIRDLFAYLRSSQPLP